MRLEWLTILPLAAVVSVGRVARRCPPKCSCTPDAIDCVSKNFTESPAGLWDAALHLDLTNNRIAALPPGAFAGFPGVTSLHLASNHIARLDFAPYAALPNLTELGLWGNGLTAVLKPPDGVRLAALEKLDLSNNRISSLDADVLAAAVPNLKFFFFTDNPAFVLQSGPVLKQPVLQHASFTRTNMSALSPQTFQRLPALQILILAESGVANITGAFADNPRLLFLDLRGCAVTEVAGDTFAAGRKLGYLSLEDNPLARLDLQSLEFALISGGLLEISDTPIACLCGYKDIYLGAKRKGVEVSATCKWHQGCSFSN